MPNTCPIWTVRADVGGVREHRGMNQQHPFHDDRPDHLPISAEVWDAARRYSGIGLSAAIYQALQKLVTDVLTLRKPAEVRFRRTDSRLRSARRPTMPQLASGVVPDRVSGADAADGPADTAAAPPHAGIPAPSNGVWRDG